MTERTCTQCGDIFLAGSNLTCNGCRTTDRTCIDCGRRFRGRERRCYDCRATDRPCEVCGHIFRSTEKTCQRCRKQKDACQMADCTEPKLRGRGYRYCAQHTAEGPRRESAQVVRRKRERQYGLTHAEFLALLEAQGRVCAICGNGDDSKDRRSLSVDHDHVTGAIRGLLCNRCNPMLGYARDDISVLEAAIVYLRR